VAGKVAQGFAYDADTGAITPCWSSCASHGTGLYVDRHRITGKGSASMFSTETLALRALRCELERKAAEALAAIDARIEKLASDS
jgi:mRNA-degrading endonuclease toxin of MazEF toxin-antitoxin module